MSTSAFKNIAGYKFVTLESSFPFLDKQKELKEKALLLNLKGTIILSPEGINTFLAGEASAIQSMIDELHQIPAFADLAFKVSFSEKQPFKRMLVKVKRQLVPMSDPDVQPTCYRGPSVSTRTLKQWLDEGKDLILLDTRNDYEYRLGSFENAINLNLKHFRYFPEKSVALLPPDAREKTIVMFCTGGIRCEKASPYLIKQGFEKVYQLEGGILQYFEDCGNAHFRGECFVFDYRVAVDSNLQQTQAALCYSCWNPLTVEDQKSPAYIKNEACPYCSKSLELSTQVVRSLDVSSGHEENSLG